MQAATSLGLILALAFLCESLTEYLFKDMLKGFKVNTKNLRYISALLGVVLCLGFGVDMFSDLLGLSLRYGPAGEVLTGLILGRGANYAHDFYTRFARKQTRS